MQKLVLATVCYLAITTAVVKAQLNSCYNRDFKPKIYQRGEYWVIQNYIGAKKVDCCEAVTYVTHADYTFLDNLIPLVQRWQAPISLALHAPGADYSPTVEAIRYLTECHDTRELINKFVSFHIYFPASAFPTDTNVPLSCESGLPSVNKTATDYPINIGRNIALTASQTYYVLPSDIELYPSLGLERKFM